MAMVHGLRPRVVTLVVAAVIAQAIGNLGFVLGDRLTVWIPAVAISLLLLVEAVRLSNGTMGPHGSGPALDREPLATITPLRSFTSAGNPLRDRADGSQSVTSPAARFDEVRPAS